MKIDVLKVTGVPVQHVIKVSSFSEKFCTLPGNLTTDLKKMSFKIVYKMHKRQPAVNSPVGAPMPAFPKLWSADPWGYVSL